MKKVLFGVILSIMLILVVLVWACLIYPTIQLVIGSIALMAVGIPLILIFLRLVAKKNEEQ